MTKRNEKGMLPSHQAALASEVSRGELLVKHVTVAGEAGRVASSPIDVSIAATHVC
jgi:hypothetical protein